MPKDEVEEELLAVLGSLPGAGPLLDHREFTVTP